MGPRFLQESGARSGAGRGQFVCMGACIIGGLKLTVRRVRVVSTSWLVVICM
jgi:hypothetical protein